MYNSRIIGTGYYVPDNIVKNKELETMMNTSDEWIVGRTGIHERRWVDPEKGETTSNMGVKAAKKALQMAKLGPEDIDFIIFATLSPDFYFPGSGVLVQEQLGCKEIGAVDIRNQCTGFVYGLAIADQFIKTGFYKNVLIIGSELHSLGLDKTERGRDVSVIFGDGAGAVVLQRTEQQNRGILSSHLHSEGKYAKELSIISPSSNNWVDRIIEKNNPDDTSYFPYMNGKFVFKNAVERFMEVIYEGLQKNKLTPKDIDLLIPHQANLRISQFVQAKLGLKDDQVFNNIMKYGNTTAASIPIALSEAVEQGKIKDGDLLCLASFGSGFTWASSIIRW